MKEAPSRSSPGGHAQVASGHVQPAATQVASHLPISRQRVQARSSDDTLSHDHSNGSIDEDMHRGETIRFDRSREWYSSIYCVQNAILWIRRFHTLVLMVALPRYDRQMAMKQS